MIHSLHGNASGVVMVTHVGDLDHKLVFTVFTEVLNQVRSRLIFSQTSTQSELLREISSLRHFNVGSTFHARRSAL